jgi:hypothetical protein
MARTASRCSRFGAERDESIDEIMEPESPNNKGCIAAERSQRSGASNYTLG